MSLELIVGPMFSGKSTELIRRVQRLQTIGKSLAVYNSVNDDRYGLDGIYTHDMKTVQCITTDTLMSQLHTSTFETADYIFIDEAQFFKDLFNFVRDIVDKQALCSKCKDGTPGIFSKRISENSGQICVGSIDTYMATCRKCFLENL